MVVVSYSGREINAKIVYYGPGLSGKTTNLEKIYDSVPESNRGRMVSMKTQTDRTLFFDLLPLDLGELSGMKTRFLLYTVPGQVYYNATRKLVLKGVDALVFVADSTPDKMAENRESLTNLEQNLKAYGLDLKTIPWVIQFNKRDLPEALPVEQMNKELNRWNVPTFEAQAANGTGVFETLRGVSKLLLSRISKDVIERDKGVGPRRAPAEKEAPATPKGKLIQALKRGKAKTDPEPEPEAPMLSEDDLLDEAPPTPMEPTPFREHPVVPGPSAREEPMVLSDQDLVIEREESRIVRSRDEDGVLSEAEIERESSYESERSSSSSGSSAGGKSIVVPIDLGSFPKSGRLRVTFEFTIDVVEESAPRPRAKGRTRDHDQVA
ncbi:MAG TPA: ADP-ribosylation factor-like protein [Candidatus Limnocylindrales bacterium]|nr:ADP-ribosylation factor-like protein [Candidatus Limnocylindrales bacterium]